ncbi:MAG: universal stress protein [Bacteroidota bacterium]
MVQEINKVVVGLSHTKLDVELIEYMNFISQTFKIREIHFVHVLNIHIPEKVLEEFPNLEKDAIEERKAEVEEMVKEHCHEECDVVHKVSVIQSSNKLKGLLEAIDKFNADLIIIGRAAHKEKASVIIQRLARRAPCQLMIIPEGTVKRVTKYNKVKTILVPIDFSEYSAIALERAVSMARNSKNKYEVKIVCQYVYALPSGYHLSGKTEDEFAEIMCNNAQESYEEFLEDINTDGITLCVEFSRDDREDLTANIREMAIKLDADILIIGSKGRTATAALFLGSFAEKLITDNTHFRLLVVRKKHEYDGILDRIKKL